MERDNVFSLQDYLAVLRRQRGLIALVTVFAAVGGAAWFLFQTPLYEARAELALERVRAAQDVSLNELLNPSGNVRDTDVDGATSASVAQSAAELLGRDDPSQLRDQVRAESVSDDRILRIIATDPDPVTAAQIADAFATSFIEFRRQEAVDTVLLTQGELEQRASEIRAEISVVDAQIAALDLPDTVTEAEAAEELGEGAAPQEETGEAAAAEEGEVVEGEVAAEEAEEEAAADEPVREATLEELDELETLQIRRNALRTQLSQVIARSTELGESADALTGFAADFTAASVPTTPTGNTLLEMVGVASILGLALGIALSFVRDHFDDVIRDEDDFKRASEGRPVLGRIPIWKPRDNDTERVASIVDPTSQAAEAYRELSAGVRFLLVAQADEPEHDAAEHHGLTRSRSVMICSASIGEGKTETAANLAVAAARVGLRTVLVDADLRRPAVAKRFGLGRTTGLSDALLNGEAAETHMVDVGVDDLYLLPAGTIPPNPAELLASPAMRAMQQGLLRKYDLVVIDTPAVLAVPDALEIGPYVDLAVLVGRVGQTGRRRLGAAMERLGQVGAAVSGTVLNGLDRATDGYYYAYTYKEDVEKKPPRQTRRERKAAERAGTQRPATPAGDARPSTRRERKAAKRAAKASDKQAKVDAKHERRASHRSRGGRGGSDQQVDRTLLQVGGAAAVKVIETGRGGAAAGAGGAAPAVTDVPAAREAAVESPAVWRLQTEPDAATPEVAGDTLASEPEPESQAAEPQAAEPETAEPQAAEPQAAEPEAAEPEAVASELPPVAAASRTAADTDDAEPEPTARTTGSAPETTTEPLVAAEQPEAEEPEAVEVEHQAEPTPAATEHVQEADAEAPSSEHEDGSTGAELEPGQPATTGSQAEPIAGATAAEIDEPAPEPTIPAVEPEPIAEASEPAAAPVAAAAHASEPATGEPDATEPTPAAADTDERQAVEADTDTSTEAAAEPVDEQPAELEQEAQPRTPRRRSSRVKRPAEPQRSSQGRRTRTRETTSEATEVAATNVSPLQRSSERRATTKAVEAGDDLLFHDRD